MSTTSGLKIGVFCGWVLNKFDKNVATYGAHMRQERKRAAFVVFALFTNSSFRLSRAVAQWLCTVYLRACMDIETNPGPDNHVNILQIMDWRFSQMIHGLQNHTTSVYRLIEDKFGNLEKDFHVFTSEVLKLKEMSHQFSGDIQDLQEDREAILERLHKLERKAEAIEKETKVNNLKFIGVKEIFSGDRSTDADMIVEMLNEHSVSSPWYHSDISRAFRVGNSGQNNQKSRPLIVQFCRWVDKMAVLDDQVLRDSLRRQGIRIAADLTSCQRETLEFYRNEGKTAYFRNGRLQFADSKPSNLRNQYRDRGDRQISDKEIYLDHDNWPQLPRRSRDNHVNHRNDLSHSPGSHYKQSRIEEQRRQDERRRLCTEVSGRREHWPDSHQAQRCQRQYVQRNQLTRWSNDGDSNGRKSRYKSDNATASEYPPNQESPRLSSRLMNMEDHQRNTRREDIYSPRTRPVVPGSHSYSKAVTSGSAVTQHKDFEDRCSDVSLCGDSKSEQIYTSSKYPEMRERENTNKQQDMNFDLQRSSVLHSNSKSPSNEEDEDIPVSCDINYPSSESPDCTRGEDKGQTEQSTKQDMSVKTNQLGPSEHRKTAGGDASEQDGKATENRPHREQSDVRNHQVPSTTLTHSGQVSAETCSRDTQMSASSCSPPNQEPAETCAPSSQVPTETCTLSSQVSAETGTPPSQVSLQSCIHASKVSAETCVPSPQVSVETFTPSNIRQTNSSRIASRARISNASPASKNLRSKQTRSKGHSPNQRNIIDSFRRAQSNDRSNNTQSRRGRSVTRKVRSNNK